MKKKILITTGGSGGHVMPALIKKFADAKFLKQDTVTCWGSGSPRRELMHVNDLSLIHI